MQAVVDATFSCEKGAIFGLLGPNGAGKTTSLRCLATILSPSGGTARVCGHDIREEPDLVRRSVGFMSASTGLYARLTPRETLRFFGGLFGLSGKALDARVAAVLAMFGIDDYADRPNDRLSTGMKQRVSIARAIIHDPPVVILDEPTSGLDPVITESVEEAVRGLAKAGKCVLLSTHSLSQAEDMCDRVGVIGGGRVLGVGTVTELCERQGARTLKEAFFSLVRGTKGEEG